MIAKDFRSAKDFPLISGKSFAIMTGAEELRDIPGRTGTHGRPAGAHPRLPSPSGKVMGVVPHGPGLRRHRSGGSRSCPAAVQQL
jgi:hypothetical protein